MSRVLIATQKFKKGQGLNIVPNLYGVNYFYLADSKETCKAIALRDIKAGVMTNEDYKLIRDSKRTPIKIVSK